MYELECNVQVHLMHVCGEKQQEKQTDVRDGKRTLPLENTQCRIEEKVHSSADESYYN